MLGYPIVYDLLTKSKGDILDIGYGWGTSSKYFYSKDVSTLTIIENDKKVYQQALKWSEDKPNVLLHFGDWKDIVPKLDRKFDGIYIDISFEKVDYNSEVDFNYTSFIMNQFHSTNSIKLEQYRKFENYAKNISNENCLLCMFDYTSIRKDINIEKSNVFFGDKLKLPNYKNYGYSYYVAGKFRKNKFFDKKHLLSSNLCDEIILQNENKVKREEIQRTIDGIIHRRNVDYTWDVEYNEKLETILNNTIFSSYKDINLNDISMIFFRYNTNDVYDRHVEVLKGLSSVDDEQYKYWYYISLNEEYEGGEFEIYDKYMDNNRNEFSLVKLKKGEYIQIDPIHHISCKKVTKGKSYHLVLAIKNKNLNKRLI